MKDLCELQGLGDRTCARVKKRSQSSSVHILLVSSDIFYLSLIFLLPAYYLTPDMEFPVQGAAFIALNVLTTLANLSQDLQFLEFLDICRDQLPDHKISKECRLLFKENRGK